MSGPALKLADAPAPVAPAGRWITAREAAARSGLNLGQVNRRCLEDWQHNGLARRGTLPSGQTGWLIDESADPRFAAVKSAEHKDAIFDPAKLGLTEAQTQEILRRRKIVADWNDAVGASANLGLTERQVTDHYIARLASEGTHVARRTLYRWLSAWRRQGIDGLIDSRWKGQRSGDDYAEFMAVLTQLWLDQRRRPLTVCYEIARFKAQESGWSFPSYGSAHRLVKKLSPAIVAKRRLGEKAFVDQIEPNIRRDYSHLASNDWWCSDDRPFDVIVQHGAKPDGSPNFVRPILHAWQDLRSRKLLAWEILATAPNSHTVLRTFVNACDAHGVPKVAYVDNGKTFDSRKLQGVTKQQRRQGIDVARVDGAFSRLIVDGEPIQTVHAWPFHGQSKPIERLFNTISTQFCKLFDTYCGRSTVEKPEDLARRLKAGQAPTLEEFARAFADWVEPAYNARAGHRGDAMDERSPNQAFTAQLAVRRVLPREVLEYATFERVGPVKVRQDGVVYQGLQFGQFDEQLIDRIGKQVRLAVDDRCLTHVYVEDLDGRLICRARANGKVGWAPPGAVDNAALREAIAEKKRVRRVVAAANAERPKLALDVPDLAIRAARQRAAAAATPPADAPIQPVRTPFDDQFAAIRRAMNGPEAQQRRADELAELDSLRPTHMRLAGDQPPPEDDDVFSSIADAMRKSREVG